MVGLDSLVESVVGIVDKVIPDKNKNKELEIELKKAVNNGEISLEQIKLESDKLRLEKDKLEKEAKLVLWEKLPTVAIFWLFLIAVGVNFIISPFIEYLVRLFHYNDIVNGGKDIASIIEFFKPPTINLPDEYYSLIKTLFGVVMTKKTVSKFSLKK